MTDHVHRLEDDHRPLTAAQRTQKTIACAILAAANATASLWGIAWTLAAAADGTLSILHITVMLACGLLAVTFGDIAERELPNL
ncbi:hypothetical protein [Bifidobacterium merycicum]